MLLLRVHEGPIARSFEATALFEEKRTLIRAIRSLREEVELGRLKPEEGRELEAPYRERLAQVIAQLDQKLAPHRKEAEKLARTAIQALRKTTEPHPLQPPSQEDLKDPQSILEQAKRLREEAERLENLAAQLSSSSPPPSKSQ
ncbi:MAG: hypothetical protein NZM37_05685 [Sandaracinaceae bacterium]|nr:hypothetical protein [Sandaracinaceae bacterium]MDW8247506.1 hypothetical protein [Sandaracinaceae bacterium]